MASPYEQHEIIPHVIDAPPPQVAEVTYEGGQKAQLGNELTPTQVKNFPKITWAHEAGAYYTLVFVDPDAPSRTAPDRYIFLHGMVANIPGDNVAAGETLFEYIGSGPPKDTGFHRYTYLIYKQPGKINFGLEKVSNRSFKGRQNFSAREFAKKYNLGSPIAGNFYVAQFDDYCTYLHSTFEK